MRWVTAFSSLGLFVLPVGAQGLTDFTVFPEDAGFSASFSSRPHWANAAEGLIQIGKDHFRGVGDNGGVCEVFGFHHFAVDQNLFSAESYALVFRRHDAAGDGPDSSNAGRISRIGGLTTPGGSFGSGFTRMRDVFQTPVTVPCGDTYYAGIEFPGNGQWPTRDGHSLFAAWVITPVNVTVGENPRANYPSDVTWAVPSVGDPFPVGATYLMGVLVDKPVLQIGGLDPGSCRNGAHLCGVPNYGLGGLFPDVSQATRADGFTIRIKDAKNPNANVFPFFALGFGPAIPLPPLFGQAHMDPRLLIPTGTLAMTGGVVEQVIAPPGSVPANAIGLDFVLQAIVQSGIRTLTFTSAQAVSF